MGDNPLMRSGRLLSGGDPDTVAGMLRWLPQIFILFVMLENSWASPSSDPTQPKESFIDRIQHPDRNRKAAYESKMFKLHGDFDSKIYKTGNYSGIKEFESKSFTTKAFESAGRSWFGKMLFPQKKLPAKFLSENQDANKSFASKAFASKEYAGLDKKNSYSTQDAFPTKTIPLKGKTQGAIDNNPKLEDAVRKGLSVDDVRNLLNKPTAF